MRGVSAALALLLAGCTTPAYWVRPDDVGVPRTPAVRASDGAEVQLASDSYRATGEPARPDGSVVVRGPGTHGWRFKAGAIALGTGLALAIGGAVLAVTNLDLSCFAEYCPPAPRPSSSKDGLFVFGVIVSVLGDVGWGGVGPALMISGALQRPFELH